MIFRIKHCLTTSLILLLAACAVPTDNDSDTDQQDGLADLSFGSDSSIEIMSWNLENFAKAGQTSINYAAQIIFYLQVDVVGLQEIVSLTQFNNLVQALNNLDQNGSWVGYRAGGDSNWQELAYIINTNAVTIIGEPFEVYRYENSAFPREPYVVKISRNGKSYIVINNHLKCCGNGIIGSNSNDEEVRRQGASVLLELYLSADLEGQNAIVIGDLNDEIQEAESQNVFWNFISQPESFKFIDMDIALGSNQYWSYPGWGNGGSHLDHILINEPLFDEFEDASSQISVIRIDDYLDGGWSEYDDHISDHRPIAWRFQP